MARFSRQASRRRTRRGAPAARRAPRGGSRRPALTRSRLLDGDLEGARGNGRGGAAAQLSDSEQQRIADVRSFARAPTTRRVYESAWRGWSAWAQTRGFPELPAAPEHVAAYLAARADEGVSVATLGVIRAAIRAVHADQGAPDPARDGVAAAMLAGL